MLHVRELFCYKGNQSHDAGFFYRIGKSSLVPGTSPVSFGRVDLALGIHEPSYKIGVLEINFFHFTFAKKTRLFFHFYDSIAFIIHRYSRMVTNYQLICTNKLFVQIRF
jgi:hypothetical protein